MINFTVFLEDLTIIGDRIDQAKDSYDKAMNKLLMDAEILI